MKERCDRITDHRAFLTEDARNRMRLAPQAAEMGCAAAADHGLLILGIEGGVWQRPGFMALIDSLWTGNAAASTEAELRLSNAAAAAFIREEAQRRDESAPDVFIVTARRWKAGGDGAEASVFR